MGSPQGKLGSDDDSSTMMEFSESPHNGATSREAVLATGSPYHGEESVDLEHPEPRKDAVRRSTSTAIPRLSACEAVRSKA